MLDYIYKAQTIEISTKITRINIYIYTSLISMFFHSDCNICEDDVTQFVDSNWITYNNTQILHDMYTIAYVVDSDVTMKIMVGYIASRARQFQIPINIIKDQDVRLYI